MAIDNVSVTQNVTNVEVAQVPATNLTVTQNSPSNVIVQAPGPQGAAGPANVLNPGTVTALAPAASPTVTITGTSPNQTINFGIPAGAKIIQGTVAPASGTGLQGDWYQNTSTWDHYEKTSATVWTLRGNIKGATGNTGPAPTLNTPTATALAVGATPTVSMTGTNPYTFNFGIPASAVWWNGTAPPATGTGAVGDYYLVSSGTGVGDVYKKTAAATWTLQGNIRGAAGTGNVSSSGTIVAGNLSSFTDTTGGLIQDAGFAASDVVRASTTQTISGTKTFTQRTAITPGGESLDLKADANDHTYMGFYARTAAQGTRSAYLGYAGVGSTSFSIQNELSAGIISIGTTGNGNINLNAGTGTITLTSGIVNATTQLQEAGARVYSANNKPTDASSFTTGILPAARMGTNVSGVAAQQRYGLRGDSTWFPITDNLVNNPSQLDSTGGWSASNSGTLTMQDSVMPDGTTARVLQSTNTGDTQNYSNIFPIDTSQAYEVRVWYKDPVVSAGGSNQFYIGLQGYTDTNATVSASYMQVASSTGATTTATSNFYFMNKVGATAGWTEYVGYVIPAGADTTLFAGLGTPSTFAQFQSNHKWMRLRILNWNNVTTPRDVQIGHVSVRAMDVDAIKSARNAASITSGTVAPARLGSGTPSATTVLLGNSTWSGLDAAGIVDKSSAQTIAGIKTFTSDQYISNGAMQYINNTNYAPPSFNTRSSGTRIVLVSSVSATAADYAIGIDNSTLWNSVDTTSHSFKWYGGNTLAATLTGAGNLSTTGTITSNGVMYAPARLRAGFNAATTSATSLTTSAAEFELSSQSLITIGENVAGQAHPAITWYRTASGTRSGTAFRQFLDGSNGPFRFQKGPNNTAYGSETYTDLVTIDLLGTVTAASFSGSGASLTALTAANISGVIPIANIPTGTTGTTVALGNHLHTGTYEPVITAGTTAQYYRGDKTWQTLNVAAVSGAAPLASPTFTGTVSGITATMVGLGNVPNVDMTNLSNAASGTVAQARLAHNVQRFVFTVATAARPTGSTYVEWVGPVQPNNAIDGDTWVNTA